MKDTYIKKRKIKALIVISILLLSLYGKNLLERRSFKQISSTFTEVYNDRLLVESYIFDISERLFQIQKLIDHCDLDYDYSKVIEEISKNENEILGIVVEFEQTQLTPEEATYLSDFKKIITQDLTIKNYGLIYSDSSGVNREQVKIYDQKISRARKDLDDLSKIQLQEGEKIISKAKTLINRSQIWAQFEVALLIILVIVLFLLIFRNSERTKGMI
ncbi:chemoreceptor-like protein with four helix bundle sensory module [Algoriphagus boseongensis]|uniref:Chemoreceptor-like protein with four helix bundle sensory module n=1 Tax=Algoriphagus boseongensis TaxID=1442587 RepID=A0A4R6T4Q8_9BACT|nr:MCP four helix bundle domain-containing protein [Algoriphagus boseongensis]TDQ16259.1 chemoreceptor-like protein with four helix bundle sensory module [Algoriphagus boseongensis]